VADDAPAGGTPEHKLWPALPMAEWRDTFDTLHLWTQIAGKVKVQLCPTLNELWHTALYPAARGLTTGPIPYDHGIFDIEFDFVAHSLVMRTSAGTTAAFPLNPQSVADFYEEFMRSLRALGIDVHFKRMTPDELPDPAPIPFDKDRVHASYDRDYVERWWTICLQTSKVLEQYRSFFAGKSSPVQFFWGGFDLAQTRFSGRPAEPPPGAGRLMRLSEDQENVACGFWPGGGKLTGPAFYSYTLPKPVGIEAVTIRPEAAHWDAGLGEFLLPYDSVREAANPAELILDFFKSTYDAGANLGNWDRARLERDPSE
jgi:hypothetical protein